MPRVAGSRNRAKYRKDYVKPKAGEVPGLEGASDIAKYCYNTGCEECELGKLDRLRVGCKLKIMR